MASLYEGGGSAKPRRKESASLYEGDGPEGAGRSYSYLSREEISMSLPYEHRLIERARKLRKEATRQEKHLWYDFLKDYPLRFQRQ